MYSLIIATFGSSWAQVGRNVLPNVVTNTDKLLMFAFEAARPDQLEAMLALSQKKGQPPAEWVADMMRFQLANLPWEVRQAVVAEFKAGEIDLESL